MVWVLDLIDCNISTCVMCPHILTWRNIFTIELLTRIKLNWSELYQATMSCDQWQWVTRAEHPLWVCLPPVSSVRLPEYYPGHDDNGWPEEQWPAGHHSAPALSRDHRPVLGPSLWWLCRHVMAGHAVIGQSGAGTWDTGVFCDHYTETLPVLTLLSYSHLSIVSTSWRILTSQSISSESTNSDSASRLETDNNTKQQIKFRKYLVNSHLCIPPSELSHRSLNTLQRGISGRDSRAHHQSPPMIQELLDSDQLCQGQVQVHQKPVEYSGGSRGWRRQPRVQMRSLKDSTEDLSLEHHPLHHQEYQQSQLLQDKDPSLVQQPGGAELSLMTAATLTTLISMMKKKSTRIHLKMIILLLYHLEELFSEPLLFHLILPPLSPLSMTLQKLFCAETYSCSSH